METAGEWKELETVKLREVTQTQKDKSHVLTCMWILALNH